MFKILVVEDDTSLCEALCTLLQKYGYEVSPVTDFRNVEDHFNKFKPHIVLLDINLPYYDGFYLMRSSHRTSHTPVIIISARNDSTDQVMGMELGADDYVVKPFDTKVLLAKVNAVIRRTYGEFSKGETNSLSLGILTLDTERFIAQCNDNSIDLTKNEFRILKLLIDSKGKVVRREALFEELWDDTSFVDENTLSVNITRVKTKLERLGLKEALKTKRSVGYYIDLTVVEVDNYE